MDPAAQVEQIDVDDAECVPLPQGVHEVAPDDTTYHYQLRFPL